MKCFILILIISSRQFQLRAVEHAHNFSFLRGYRWRPSSQGQAGQHSENPQKPQKAPVPLKWVTCLPWGQLFNLLTERCLNLHSYSPDLNYVLFSACSISFDYVLLVILCHPFMSFILSTCILVKGLLTKILPHHHQS